MISCHVTYQIDPREIDAFERFARRWIALVTDAGGIHHGYFLPNGEGSSDVAYAVFSFSTFQSYEQYRSGFGQDSRYIDADRIRDESSCVVRYERTFLRPVLDGDASA